MSASLKFISDWFVTNKIFEKLDNVIFSDDYKDLDDVDSDIVTSFSDGMSLVIIDLNNINLDDDNLMKMILKLLFFFRLVAWCNRYKPCKSCKK